MKKLLIACAAVMTAAVAMATASFAAYDYTTNATEVSLDATASAAVELLADQQLTVLIVKADDTTKGLPKTISDTDILYINQDAKGTLSLANMKVKNALPDGDYVIAIGGETLSEIIVDTFTVGTESVTPPTTETKTVIWGDIDMNSEVADKDALDIISKLSGATVSNQGFTVGVEVAEGIIWGDIDVNGEVADKDALDIISKLSGATVTNQGYTVGASTELTLITNN